MKTKVKKSKWLKGIQGNEILQGKGFFVSFAVTSGFGVFSGDTDTETALVKNGVFYILNGNFKDEYEELVSKGFKACKKFYDSKKDTHGSSWSTD